MATIRKSGEKRRFVELRNGDHMNREEFHEAYSQMPEGFSAELLGGIVFVSEPSPLRYSHGAWDLELGSLLKTYSRETPGTGAAANVTVQLGAQDEPQPDLILRIKEEFGGRSRVTEDNYVSGPPELVAEIAYSSRAKDLHLKKERYALGGVLEYVVLCVDPPQLHWFDLQNKTELEPDAHGIFRSVVFPGLWIHAKGLLDQDDLLTADALQHGLKSEAHSNFVAKLGASKRS
jgi:Uma2 family endonuclease